MTTRTTELVVKYTAALGVESGLESAADTFRPGAAARARELPAEAAHIAFTRDRILFALAEAREVAAKNRAEAEAALPPDAARH